MKLKSNLFIATAVVGLFSASSAQANISNALHSVCSSSGGEIISTTNSIQSSADSERNDYRSKLATHYNDTNCVGKRMIETSKDRLVYQTIQSEPNDTLAAAPN